MAVLKKSEIMEQVKGVVGENTDDATLKFLEDLNDTLNDYEAKQAGDGEDWKKKYEELDADWRKKYQQTFFNPVPTKDENGEESNDLTKPTDDVDEVEDDEPKHFEDLFTTES